ncbi:hypothetical protein BJ508DRAFT_310391 [Ascobolus immersus RN42]|uniref:Uncharacterized protein n=1 Tax=Ascobolus immersus RN42 TaxID=1160509 RepID=A0A3N4HVD0_ASCIM|nr:hypothetical protein BJ508DRAFT_310391 [Ascobolus immersus RN42]
MKFSISNTIRFAGFAMLATLAIAVPVDDKQFLQLPSHGTCTNGRAVGEICDKSFKFDPEGGGQAAFTMGCPNLFGGMTKEIRLFKGPYPSLFTDFLGDSMKLNWTYGVLGTKNFETDLKNNVTLKKEDPAQYAKLEKEVQKLKQEIDPKTKVQTEFQL